MISRELRSWFVLSPREQWFVGLLATIFLIGLIARYVYLRSEESGPVPEGLILEPASTAGPE